MIQYACLPDINHPSIDRLRILPLIIRIIGAFIHMYEDHFGLWELSQQFCVCKFEACYSSRKFSLLSSAVSLFFLFKMFSFICFSIFLLHCNFTVHMSSYVGFLSRWITQSGLFLTRVKGSIDKMLGIILATNLPMSLNNFFSWFSTWV